MVRNTQVYERQFEIVGKKVFIEIRKMAPELKEDILSRLYTVTLLI